MQLIPVGFVVKSTAPAIDWLRDTAVVETASASGCISSNLPEDVEDYVNALGFYNSEASALRAAATQMTAPGDLPRDMYAFALLPRIFRPAGATPLACTDIPAFGYQAVAGEIPRPEFELLGYDCVSTQWDSNVFGIGCSPLSCNGLARKIAANRYCLFDDLAAAVAGAELFAETQPEPGAYLVFEVRRLRRGTSAL